MELLTENDGQVLYEARILLSALQERASRSAWNAHGTTGAHLGRLAQACETAGDAVFDVLNVSISYLHDPEAKASHDRWMGRHAETVS